MGGNMSRIALCSSLILLLGCASVKVTRITDENRVTAEGIRFWRPAPYLAVFGEKDGTCSVRIIYLPDPSEEYAIRATAGIGSASLKPTLTDGWNLTAYDSQVDSKVSDLVGAVSKLVPVSGAKTITEPPKPSELTPGLYRVKMDRNTGSLSLDLSGVYRAGLACGTVKVAPEAGGKDGGGKNGE
jgi:hypothetical protein